MCLCDMWPSKPVTRMGMLNRLRCKYHQHETSVQKLFQVSIKFYVISQCDHDQMAQKEQK